MYYSSKSLVLILLTLQEASHIAGNDKEPLVDTPLGKIRGFVLTSRLGNPIYSFTSIRYAKAPVGALRFQPPVPIEKWVGVYDATKPGPVCPQPNNVNSSEDCLMLNVYANKLPKGNEHLERPVIVFLHPGGFSAFTGAIHMFGPQYLLDQNLVLVTANYRLGSLGFLSTGTKEAPGNNGFKDQVVVLKWVRDNIREFGGNPNLVTLSGCSAGSASTSMHMVSPMSKGLFHRAIMMSATSAGQLVIPPNQYDLARKQARLVNCSDETPEAIVSCLKTKDAQEIADTLPGFAEVGNEPILIWNAVIEPDFGQERFLTEHPIKSMIDGRFANIPVMLGITQAEIGFLAYFAIRLQWFLDLLSNDYKRILPIILNYERHTPKSNNISTALKHFYFGDGPVENTTETRIAMEHLYADGMVGFSEHRAAKLISDKNKANTYYYCFTYKGRYSYFYLPDTNKSRTAGVVHHDDLQYLFYMPTFFSYITKDDPEWVTVDKMVKIWTNFAYTGNPTPEESDLLNRVKWEPYCKNSTKYMDIGEKLVMKEKLYEDRYKVWEKSFPLQEYV